MLNKMERRFGKYAVPHLINYLLMGYGIGYLLYLLQNITGYTFLSMMTLEPFRVIHGFQFWRIITWVMIPPFSMRSFMDLFFALIMIYLYWQLGTVLEAQWGTFRFNLYIWGGVLFTLIGSFLFYGISLLVTGIEPQNIGAYISTGYINMSIFLAFAMSFPEMKVYLYFIIPIKMKWMAIVYAVITVYQLLVYPWGARVAIINSLLNFVILFFSTRNYRSIDPREIHRKNEYRRKTREGNSFAWHQQTGQPQPENKVAQGTSFNVHRGPVARHKCAICGRTELSNPELEFRFCSKCNGNYEYCQDHLFTHEHS